MYKMGVLKNLFRAHDRRIKQKWFFKFNQKTQESILEEQLEEKCRIMARIEEGITQINTLNENVTEACDEIQRAKFWLYVANNELEKEKLKYKLRIH